MEKMSSLTFPDGSTYEIVDAEARLEVSKTQEVTTDKFNSDIDYVAGDLCIYNNVLYKFITSKSAGEWDSEAVEVTSVKKEMNNLQNQVNALNSKISGKILHGKITVNINAVAYLTFPENFGTTPSVFLTANDHSGSVLVTPYDISSAGITLKTRNIDNGYPYSTIEIGWLAIG